MVRLPIMTLAHFTKFGEVGLDMDRPIDLVFASLLYMLSSKTHKYIILRVKIHFKN